MIKKVNPQELEALRLRPLGKKHPVRQAIENLAVGEAILIPLTDFKWKRKTPTYFTNQLSKTSTARYQVSKVHNNGGWTVERKE